MVYFSNNCNEYQLLKLMILIFTNLSFCIASWNGIQFVQIFGDKHVDVLLWERAHIFTKFACDVQYFNIRYFRYIAYVNFMFGCKICKVTWFCICVLFSTRMTQAINKITILLLLYVCDFHRNPYVPLKADI